MEECGHEVLVANARKLRLIYSNKRKTDEIDAENLARLASLWCEIVERGWVWPLCVLRVGRSPVLPLTG